MKSLGFVAAREGRAYTAKEKRIREARFEARSSLPASAACVVANGVRETLSSLLGGPVAVRLLEPSVPGPEVWRVILQDARLYRVRGKVADAAVILRPSDAVALAATLFGESHAGIAAQRTLSPIECDVLDRMVGAIAANLAAVCGAREGNCTERVASIRGFVTYFELLVEPAGAGIGIALSRDPSPEAGAPLDVAHLAGVKLTALASLDAGSIEVAGIARLAVGAIVPLAPADLHRCTLVVHGHRFARGSCGVRNDRYAFHVDAIHEAI